MIIKSLHISLFLDTLAVSLGSVVTVDDNQVLGAVVVLAGQVRLEDSLGTVGVTLLGIERSSRHVGDHGIATTEGVLGVAQDVVLGGGLREPHVTTVAAELARLEGVGDVLLDDNGTTSSVDEP